MKYLTIEEMKKLTTERLMAYKRKYFGSSVYPCCKVCEDHICGDYCKYLENKKNHFDTYFNLKNILSERENLKCI